MTEITVPAGVVVAQTVVDYKGHAEVNKSTEQVAKSMGDTANRAQQFAARAASAAIIGLGATTLAFVKAAQASMAFESSFAGIRKTVEATEEEFAQLKDQIFTLASVTPVTADELNRIGELGGQLGVAVQNLPDFIRTVSQIAIATNLTVDNAALGLARLDAIAQTNGETFSNVSSTIVELGNNFAATESEIMTTVLRIAQAAAQVGATTQDALAFATALQAIGVPAQAGGTAVARVFQAINSAIIQAGEEAEKFAQVAASSGKVSQQSFEQLFGEDPAQATRLFIEGLAAINEQGGDVVSILDQLGLSQRRTMLAILGLAEAGDLLERTLITGREAFEENTAATEEALKRFATLESQLQITRNIFNELGVQIGDDFLPVLKEANQFIQEVTLGLIESEKGALLLKTAIVGLTSVLVAAGVALGTFTKAAAIFFGNPVSAALTAFGLLFTTISIGSAKAQGEMELLKRTLDAFSGEGITEEGVRAALEGDLDFQSFLDDVEFLNPTSIKVQTRRALAGSSEEFAEFFKDTNDELNFLADVAFGADFLASFSKNQAEFIKEGRGTVQDFIDIHLQGYDQATGEIMGINLETIQRFSKLSKAQQEELLGNASGQVDELSQLIKFLEKHREAQRELTKEREKEIEVQALINLGLDEYVPELAGMIEAQKDAIRSSGDLAEAEQDLSDAFQEATTMASVTQENVRSSVDGLFSSLERVTRMTVMTVEEMNRNLAEKLLLKEIFEDAINQVLALGFDDIALEFSKLGPESLPSLLNLLADPQALRDREVMLEQAALSDVEKIKEAMFGTDEEVEDLSSKVGKSYVDGVINGILGRSDDLKEAAGETGKTVVSVFENVLGIESPSRVTKELGEFLMLGFVDGIKASFPTLETEVRGKTIDLVNIISQSAREANTAIGSAFRGQFGLFSATSQQIASEQRLNDLIKEQTKLLKGNTAEMTKNIQDAKDKRDFLKIAFEEGTISLAEYQLAEEELQEAESARADRLEELDSQIQQSQLSQAQNQFNLAQSAFQLLQQGPEAIDIFKRLGETLGIDASIIDSVVTKTSELANTLGQDFANEVDGLARKFFDTNLKIEQEEIMLQVDSSSAIGQLLDFEKMYEEIKRRILENPIEYGLVQLPDGNSPRGGGGGGLPKLHYAGGGRIPMYANGGTLRSGYGVVGEHGPEFIRAIPGGGVDITPMGNYGTSSIRVDNLNVNVTGVPSDPMQARKAAIQIKKELAKLDREGLIGTGIRGR